MRIWLDPISYTPPSEYITAVSGYPLVADVLYRRGIQNIGEVATFLNPNRYTPCPAEQLPDIERAVERIEGAISHQEPIFVWGDFDVDGQTSTALLVSALNSLGAVVNYHIPVRAEESHGINIPHLDLLINQGASLLLTCDTGITANEAVDYAKNRGVDAIITDHHDLPTNLPNAYALVNPKRLPSVHPLASLPGVGVAYKLVEALFQRSGKSSDLPGFLDLVALGIVADMATLREDNRYLLQTGLPVLRSAKRTGLRAIMNAADLNPAQLNEEHIGYMIAPRLNALGRLGDANSAVELLITKDESRARIIAVQLEGLNAQRRLLTGQVLKGALSQLERNPSLLQEPALVLTHPDWPAGVIGIVASELVERFNKPVILFSSPTGVPARGSCRSVEGINITSAIAANQRFLHGFGGHAMAAGLSIDAEKIPQFQRAFNRTVAEMMSEALSEPSLPIDAYVSLSDLNIEFAQELNRLSPFGAGFPPVTLATRNLGIVKTSTLGRNGDHLQVVVADETGLAQKITWWNGSSQTLPDGRFDLAFTLRTSSYLGQPEMTVEWLDARPQEEVEIAPQPKVIKVIDYRKESHPLPILQKIVSECHAQVWAEGATKAQVGGLDRRELNLASELVIWTTPPGPNELKNVIERTNPRTIYLFAVDPIECSYPIFSRSLLGMIKYILNHYQGKGSISDLAAATAQRESTVRRFLTLLGKIGYIEIEGHGEIIDDQVMITRGSTIQVNGKENDAFSINRLLDETNAYRKYFRLSDAAVLINSEVSNG
jgi:single-stranded-DNA-specific exonuclease